MSSQTSSSGTSKKTKAATATTATECIQKLKYSFIKVGNEKCKEKKNFQKLLKKKVLFLRMIKKHTPTYTREKKMFKMLRETKKHTYKIINKL